MGGREERTRVTMKTIWLNDIHLEFLDEPEFMLFLRELEDAHAYAILIAGDIAQAFSVTCFLRRMHDRLGVPIYFVLGNHDFYHGSILEVRSAIRTMADECAGLFWLNACGVIPLAQRTSLIGHDGWCDGRLGGYEKSGVQLNDFRLISELTGLSRTEALMRLMELGDEAAAHFRSLLPEALATSEHVVVVTHVPPFVEAAWYDGRYCDADWLPFFSCKSVGDVLASIMQKHPDKHMTVLCGHTHGGGQSWILPNLITITGPARYGHPAIQKVFEWK